MYSRSLKRLLDITLAGLALVALAPLMLLVALLIKLEDGGPVHFRQKRVGKGGREFEFLKFRSMPVNAANVPKTQAIEIPITRIGRVIRRTNIDELPQLINILRGEMSIVGPRPAIAAQGALISMRRENGALSCTPGLTGLAQVNAYDGMPETEKAGFDGEYASNVSFANDLKIIGRTFGYLTRKPPVY
jgi:O-antigen biosynthesis protein WbqP